MKKCDNSNNNAVWLRVKIASKRFKRSLFSFLLFCFFFFLAMHKKYDLLSWCSFCVFRSVLRAFFFRRLHFQFVLQFILFPIAISTLYFCVYIHRECIVCTNSRDMPQKMSVSLSFVLSLAFLLLQFCFTFKHFHWNCIRFHGADATATAIADVATAAFHIFMRFSCYFAISTAHTSVSLHLKPFYKFNDCFLFFTFYTVRYAVQLYGFRFSFS